MARPSVRPVRWSPPAARARASQHSGPAPLPRLSFHDLPGHGPEDVLVESLGRIITGLDDGRVLRLSADGRTVETIADTEGRPLGIELCLDGTLVVCDSTLGLLPVDPAEGLVTALTTDAAGVPLRLGNNAAVAGDGAIYFTDSSLRFGIAHWRADLIEHSQTGRLLRINRLWLTRRTGASFVLGSAS